MEERIRALMREHVLDTIDEFGDADGTVALEDVVALAQERYATHELFPEGRARNSCPFTEVDLEARCEVERVPWARSYRERAERLIETGRMQPSGLRAVQHARDSGWWDVLDHVDDLVVPDDLAVALAAHPPAAEHFAGFPPSTRRNVLRWIAMARTAPTRARRVALTCAEAQQGRRVKSNG